MNRLRRYLEYCRVLIKAYESGSSADAKKLCSYVVDAIALIRSNPKDSRSQFASKLLSLRNDVSVDDADKALTIAVKVLLMMNCGYKSQSTEILESGSFLQPWNGSADLVSFVLNSFPRTDPPTFRDDEAAQTSIMKSKIQARKLTRQAGLSFVPTDDIRDHLKLDHKAGVVHVFHYTAFLKEQLRVTLHIPQATAGLSQDTVVTECIRAGTLPRQLVLEVLDSIQKILFPISDNQSYALLDSLTGSKSGSFDPDCVHFESEFRHADEKDVAYYYFGSRLMDLYQEAESPRLRGLLAGWLERKSGARYVMLATLVGVLLPSSLD